MCVKITERLCLKVFREGELLLRTEIGTGCEGCRDKLFESYLSGEGDIEVPFKKLDLSGYSSRVVRVYKTLKKEVPPGELITYSELGKLSGEHPRFVGYCMRINRFPLIIPCHRVVSKGELGGFSYGLSIKRELIEFERKLFRNAHRRDGSPP